MKKPIILKTVGLTFLMQLMSISFSFSQEISVQGYVTDIFNRILMGISIKSAETSNEVFSDSMGFYQIKSPAKGKLIFSGEGFASQRIAIKGKTTIDVSLNFDLTKNNKDNSSDTAKSQKMQSTNVSQNLLKRNKELGIDQLLKTIAGVQVVFVGPEMKVLIHGIKSLNANNFALIVLNGFVYTGSLSDLNRNDVESIEVLKDPAALASWGSQGANGVVLISTKNPK